MYVEIFSNNDFIRLTVAMRFVLDIDSDKVHFSQAITLANAQHLKVMNEDAQALDEVVVTALGIKRSQKALSYNVQEIKGDEITTVKNANFMNSLSGKVAGVNINASTSGVGGATRVVMRGTKSISSDNNALYVIDGVPIFNSNKGDIAGQYSVQPRGEGISDINPEDIESMSVLSGPAAAALYGSSAASGVILITIKKGKEGVAKVTISNNSTFSHPFIMPEFQNTYLNAPGSYASWGNKEASPFDNYNPEDFFNTGTNIQNTVSLSVGNDKNQTYVSVGEKGFQGGLRDMSNVYSLYNIDTQMSKDTYPIEDGSKQRTYSYFVSAELGWRSMIYLTLTGRNDWDSALTNTEQPSFFYPSVGLSVVITEMVKLPAFISYLKARGSYASVGAPITKSLVSKKTYEFDKATSQWKLQTYRPLPKLYPERTDSWEAGLNAKFFNNSLSLDITWYKSNTKKQTFLVPLSGTSIYAGMYAQSGNVENKGMEFSLGYRKHWGDFGWNSNVTFSFN